MTNGYFGIKCPKNRSLQASLFRTLFLSVSRTSRCFQPATTRAPIFFPRLGNHIKAFVAFFTCGSLIVTIKKVDRQTYRLKIVSHGSETRTRTWTFATKRKSKEEKQFEAIAFGCFCLSVARVYIARKPGGGSETTCER